MPHLIRLAHLLLGLDAVAHELHIEVEVGLEHLVQFLRTFRGSLVR